MVEFLLEYSQVFSHKFKSFMLQENSKCHEIVSDDIKQGNEKRDNFCFDFRGAEMKTKISPFPQSLTVHFSTPSQETNLLTLFDCHWSVFSFIFTVISKLISSSWMSTSKYVNESLFFEKNVNVLISSASVGVGVLCPFQGTYLTFFSLLLLSVHCLNLSMWSVTQSWMTWFKWWCDYDQKRSADGTLMSFGLLIFLRYTTDYSLRCQLNWNVTKMHRSNTPPKGKKAK